MSTPKHFLILAFLFACIPSIALSQQVVLSFDEGFLGELGNNKCVTNCEYTSTLGITNLRFGQVNDTGQFTSTAQGNDVPGFIRFLDANNVQHQIPGNLQWRITTGNTARAFGFVPTNTSTVTIQTTSGSFNINGLNQASTSTFGFILEGLTVTVAAGESESGNAAGPNTVDNLNTELDKQPRIIISDVTVNEGDGIVTVTVSFDPGNGVDIGASPAPTEQSTVEYSILDSTAQAGSDYSNVSGTLTFPSGSTASQTFTIPITDDTIIEEDEFIIALLSSPTGDISISDNKGIVTILDNDTEQGGDLTLTLTQRSCWRFLSSPFQNLTYDDIIGPLWTQGATGSDDPPPATDESVSNIFIWDKSTTSNAVSGWTTTGLNLNSAIPAGEGFLMSIFEDDNADGTIDVSEEFDKTITITGTAHPFDATISPTLNTNPDGWTLVGNPFNDAIDFGYLVANGLTTDLTDVAYVYNINGSSSDPATETNNNPGGWVSTSGGSIGDLHDGKIAVFQGFFVQNSSTATNPGITFNNASRTTGATFYGKQKEQKDYVRLELNGESVYNSAWVAFSKTGRNMRVKGDAFELIPFKDKYSLLASRKGDDILDIGQFSNDAGTEIPIYTEFANGGTYTIKATDVRLHSTKDLYFKDNENGSITPIDENFNYQFFVSKSQKNQGQIAQLSCGSSGHEFAKVFSPVRAEKSNSSEDRFSIIVGSVINEESEIPENVTLDQNYPNPFNPTTQIRYQLPQQSNVLLEVYDLTGKLIITLVNETVSAGSHTVRFNASTLSSGVYMYRLQTGDNILSRKLTIIK